MKYANQENIVSCDNCGAQYDKTIKWVTGHYEGTSSYFNVSGNVREYCCPICRKENQ